tara:strand:- start:1649 stop:2023 length:375 start_codon:yes stop_codon:yes gene_type:complete
MNKKKHPTFTEKIELIESLEDFFTNYEPKFGEKIKVRRFLKNLKEMKMEQQDAMLMLRLSKIKDSNLKKKDIDLLKSLDKDTLEKYLEKLKRKNNLPLIVRLMERVNKPQKNQKKTTKSSKRLT